jgi:hypothetical protein
LLSASSDCSERRSCTKPTRWDKISVEEMDVRGWDYAPVRTMTTAMLILMASSTLPMIALTTALPHKRRISGLS